VTRRQLALLALVSVSIKITLILTTNGTMDALMWDTSAAKIRAEGGASVYRTNVPLFPGGVFAYVSLFNHPPFMVHVLNLFGGVAESTGTRVRDWIRIGCTLADAGALIVVSRIAAKILGLRGFWPIALVALSPVQLLISGFHTNTDPIMMLLVVSAIYFIEVRRAEIPGGLCLGAALCIKVVPVLLLPAMVAWLPQWRIRARFVVSAAGLWLLASMPWILEVPREIIRNVFGYGSMYGWWGISGILHALRGQLPWLDASFSAAGSYVVAGAAAILGVVLARRSTLPLFCQCGLVMFVFVFFTPGFGVQYLSWLTPWLLVLPTLFGVLHAGAAGSFLALLYVDWQGGTARSLADRLALGHLTGLLEATKAAAWLSTLAAAIAIWVVWRRWRNPGI
jgi:hypothetical protein